MFSPFNTHHSNPPTNYNLAFPYWCHRNRRICLLVQSFLYFSRQSATDGGSTRNTGKGSGSGWVEGWVRSARSRPLWFDVKRLAVFEEMATSISYKVRSPHFSVQLKDINRKQQPTMMTIGFLDFQFIEDNQSLVHTSESVIGWSLEELGGSLKEDKAAKNVYIKVTRNRLLTYNRQLATVKSLRIFGSDLMAQVAANHSAASSHQGSNEALINISSNTIIAPFVVDEDPLGEKEPGASDSLELLVLNEQYLVELLVLNEQYLVELQNATS
ncbi:OLC1v1018899C1 [Oldenlandia corymbosa var. corymbosa]|uniref:OLC1v1018899C1 n=1 Tax=Oldenlandia corymbosa var. corymbosa TaxID=529605 RepID=A0AAV1ECU2_OLDCO|nr:OLC1v1018899C1 [Oldenlandia corymbosa var. corymbosa]